MPKNKGGRPPKPADEKLIARIEFNARPDQEQAYKDAAKADDLPLAAWIRKKLDKAAKRY